MLEKQSAGTGDAIGNDASPRAEGGTAVRRATKSEPTDPPSKPDAPPKHRKRRLVIGVLGILVLVAVLMFGVPWIRLILNTVSTDDSYVNGHVTFVAARVNEQIARVLVDDNNRVHKGDVLAQLDKEPYEDEVAVKRAAVDTAKADLQAAIAMVRGVEAQARSLFWQLETAIEDVDNRVALL